MGGFLKAGERALPAKAANQIKDRHIQPQSGTQNIVRSLVHLVRSRHVASSSGEIVQPAGSIPRTPVGATGFRLGSRVRPRSWDPASQENPVQGRVSQEDDPVCLLATEPARETISPRIGSQYTSYRFRQRSGR
jgi:hypothetical protein